MWLKIRNLVLKVVNEKHVCEFNCHFKLTMIVNNDLETNIECYAIWNVTISQVDNYNYTCFTVR